MLLQIGLNSKLLKKVDKVNFFLKKSKLLSKIQKIIIHLILMRETNILKMECCAVTKSKKNHIFPYVENLGVGSAWGSSLIWCQSGIKTVRSTIHCKKGRVRVIRRATLRVRECAELLARTKLRGECRYHGPLDLYISNGTIYQDLTRVFLFNLRLPLIFWSDWLFPCPQRV